MLWHTVLIRWCLFIHYKSVPAYEGKRAFSPLPSARTLFDYTHFTENGHWLNEKVLQQLVNLRQQLNLYDKNILNMSVYYKMKSVLSRI